MNVIGEIGNFIIQYQEPIQTGVVATIAVAIFVVIIKLFSSARKKSEILAQINETVSEINATVHHLSEKKTEVIYIDSRVRQRVEEPKEADFIAVDEIIALANKEVSDKQEYAIDQDDQDETEVKPSLKYFSRDCAISKNGKRFTLEELNAQIKD